MDWFIIPLIQKSLKIKKIDNTISIFSIFSITNEPIIIPIVKGITMKRINPIGVSSV